MTTYPLIAPCGRLPIIWPASRSMLQAGRHMGRKPFHVAGWQTYDLHGGQNLLSGKATA